MNCDHGRETVVRTGEAPSLGRKADRIALTGEVRGFPRLNRRPYGRGHGAQGHGDSGGDGRGVSCKLIPGNSCWFIVSYSIELQQANMRMISGLDRAIGRRVVHVHGQDLFWNAAGGRTNKADADIEYQTEDQRSLRNCSTVSPASRTIPPSVKDLIGSCLGMVSWRFPSLMTICLPCRTTWNPAFSRARTAS